MNKQVALVATFVVWVTLACNALSPAAPQIETPPTPQESAPAEEAAPTEADAPEATEATESNVEPTTEPQSAEGAFNPDPPDHPVKLIFIHHSSGENWLSDGSGGLGIALRDNNYFVSDTNYDWGPNDSDLDGPIGSYTDIGNWWNWFLSPNRDAVMEAVFNESERHADYSRLADDPGGENEIVMFKSCFPNSGLYGSPDDPPTVGDNPLFGQDSGSEFHSVASAKGIYVELLKYFSTRPDKLFIVVTAPPLHENSTSPEGAANARAFNRWLVNDWLKDYPLNNVAVFDFYNVLTSNGSDPDTNDVDAETGNHHRYRDGQIEYITDQAGDYSAYATPDDSHPTAAGNQKATAEFVPILNIVYHWWKGD
ncbi:MAG TPA: hypothetical protein VJL59_06025 [Anaerolineales bacterium]|nr:hypothetical protein [Anaerolineales bacterium]